jgi:hypothetical protein
MALVNQARREFLARAGFARDVDGGLAAGQPLYRIAHLLHGSGIAQHALGAERGFRRGRGRRGGGGSNRRLAHA